MNHKQVVQFSQILMRTDLEEILDALHNELPELLRVVQSPTIEPCNMEGVTALEGSNRVLRSEGALVRSSPLYYHHGRCGYYSRADTIISFSKHNCVDTIQRLILLEVQVLLEEIQYLSSRRRKENYVAKCSCS